MQRIIVCIKHVPDTGVPLRLNAGATGVEPADFVGIPNPPDLSAVELAVQIVDGFPGEVIVVSLGPAEAAATLRQGLALGATRGILISDPALEGADAYATAMVLATLVSSLHPRIVLCGARSLDGSAGLVGPALAEALGFVHIGRVTVVSVQGPESIVVERKLERGVRERVRDRLWRRGEFIERYIFPDGEVVQLAELVRAAELAGFETRDVESLREHYARTLRHWSSRLEAHHAEAAGMVGEAAYRVWRLYLAAAARGFATGRLAVVQLLLAKPDANGRHVVPLTRSDLYGETRHGGPGAIT